MTASDSLALVISLTIWLACTSSPIALPCTSSWYPCGKPTIQPAFHRIVGGHEARRGSWPWTVVVAEENYAACAGAIISERFVLSAAHCFLGQSNDPRRWKVVAGKHRLDRLEPEEKRIQVREILVHERFDNQTISNDIALLILEEALPFSSLIKPICLPDYGKGVTTGQICVLAGWGKTQGTGDRAVLNQVSLPIISDDTCLQPDWYGADFVPNISFCAGYEQGGRDGCEGDSGAPLICRTGDTWYAQGISSWGYRCAEVKWPGIYTNVTNYVPWIKDKMSQYGTCHLNVVG